MPDTPTTPAPKPKKIVYKIKPHIVHVGPKKPDNGSKPIPEQPPAIIKKSLLSKCIEVIKEDAQKKVFRTKAVVEDKPPGWEDYLRFLELSKPPKKE